MLEATLQNAAYRIAPLLALMNKKAKQARRQPTYSFHHPHEPGSSKSRPHQFSSLSSALGPTPPPPPSPPYPSGNNSIFMLRNEDRELFPPLGGSTAPTPGVHRPHPWGPPVPTPGVHTVPYCSRKRLSRTNHVPIHTLHISVYVMKI